jgi:hypothetical protein
MTSEALKKHYGDRAKEHFRMNKCQHEDCERSAVAEWNGCNFCDEHVRERLCAAADNSLIAENKRLRAELLIVTADRDSLKGMASTIPELAERLHKARFPDAGAGEPK